VQGLVRPCRHHLGSELYERWRAHLCGLCLTLRDNAGQSSRVLTGYDALLLSVLVEAQAGRQQTHTAGRCPLRGMRTAEVLRADTPAMQLAAAGALLVGSAGLRDKLTDHDLPYGTRAVGRLGAERLEDRGVVVATRIGLSASAVLSAPARAAAAESRTDATLTDLLEPTGEVVAALFAHSAVVAARPENAGALRFAGEGYGRLVHLLDAVADQTSDDGHGRFNPLTATGSTRSEAHRLAQALADRVAESMSAVAWADPALAVVLLGPELGRAVSRTFRVGHPQVALTGVLTAVTLFGFPRDKDRKRRDRDDGWCGDLCNCCPDLGCDCCDCCDCGVCDCC
jgi:hypothetical protein